MSEHGIDTSLFRDCMDLDDCIRRIEEDRGQSPARAAQFVAIKLAFGVDGILAHSDEVERSDVVRELEALSRAPCTFDHDEALEIAVQILEIEQ